MNKLIYTIWLVGLTFMFTSCSDFLEVDPIAAETESNFFDTPENAVYAVNACYDLIGMTEGPGPDGQWLTHNYEWFFGDLLSDDSEKGSTEADFTEIQDLIEWRTTSDNRITVSLWIKCYDGIYRTNNVLLQLENSDLDEDLRNRLKGEASFIRGYWYFYLVKVFGGVPVFTSPVTPDQFGNVARASYHETFEQAISDFRTAVELLPEQSAYDASDLGRATKGAARTFLARALMYQIGMDAENTTSWQEVYDQTNAVIKSGEYALVDNYATIFEMDGENSSESVFELQMEVGSSPYAPQKTGTNSNQFQGNRKDWGWGFNNPTVNLFAAFEENDPRLTCIVYGETVNDGVVHGVKQEYDLSQQMTPYLNRKAALEPAFRPANNTSSPANIRMARYAEVLLTHAEAAFRLGKEGEARDMVNLIRERARTSTFPKGSVEGDLSYLPTGYTGNLPEIDASGNELLEAIYHERRIELAVEGLRFWDLVRTGKYLDMLDLKKSTFKIADDSELRYASVDLRANCLEKCIDGADGNMVPLFPIPLAEVQDWGLDQNKGYN